MTTTLSIEAANACNPTTASVDISTNNNDPVEVFEQEFLVEHISTSKDILGSNACGHETTDSEVDDLLDEGKRSKCAYVEPPGGWNLTQGVDGGPCNPELIRSFGGHVAYYIWTRQLLLRGGN
ncbi:hypothetical protein Leryth_004581 [Lithospermum erythrorhizon]|nr:hypothetical protein Leryth_004581 [Lithospermum erythrorhizon]